MEVSGGPPTKVKASCLSECERHQTSARQQKARVQGYRTEKSLVGDEAIHPGERGTTQSISVLEQIPGRLTFKLAENGWSKMAPLFGMTDAGDAAAQPLFSGVASDCGCGDCVFDTVYSRNPA